MVAPMRAGGVLAAGADETGGGGARVAAAAMGSTEATMGPIRTVYPTAAGADGADQSLLEGVFRSDQ